ncbi:copper-binding protein [Thermithiobacillus plumbiphilus]|uniref:Copper-binding protein n=1 Tax=Thermithiobacillus plumbiphilus TaxID=1729899 RepID=A0ABU9D826_9PROT
MNTGKVNLTHAPIPSLGWSAMTMNFQTKNKAELSNVKVGQKVNFELIKGADGQYLITRISPAKS